MTSRDLSKVSARLGVCGSVGDLWGGKQAKAVRTLRDGKQSTGCLWVQEALGGSGQVDLTRPSKASLT